MALTSAVSGLGSCRRNSSGTRLCSTSFRSGPRSPIRSPPRPRRTSVPSRPTAEARTESRACVGGSSQGVRRSKKKKVQGQEGGQGGAKRKMVLGGCQRPRAELGSWGEPGRGGLGGGGGLGGRGLGARPDHAWRGQHDKGRGGVLLTSSSSGGRRGLSSELRRRSGARGCSSNVRSAPSAAPTSRASPSPRAPKRAGSSVFTCRTCGDRD
jgi:hypothetical protein